MALSLLLMSLIMINGFAAVLFVGFGWLLELKNKNPAPLFIWSAVLFATGLGVLEYAFWLEDMNFFSFVAGSFPLMAFFAGWLAFYIWLFESFGLRKVWVVLVAALVVLILAAAVCMNCL